MTFESIGNSKSNDYKYNSLNQQVQKIADGKDSYSYSFDKRGNLVKSVCDKKDAVTEQYVYDASNRMVKGVNEAGEQSFYVFDGLGNLAANEWIIAKNAYGYTGVNTDPAEQVNGVVVCDRHKNTSGNGHIDPVGKGHTTGGTTGGAVPVIDNTKFSVIHKDYVIDYTSVLKNVLMETESGAGGLTYRNVYGLQQAETVICGIPEGAGDITQFVYQDQAGITVLTSTDPGKDINKDRIVKLYNHQDRLGTIDYLTDNVSGKAASYVTYDDWGALTAKAILKMGVRELDLVQEYTTSHHADMVLGVFYSKARMYDAGDRRFMAKDPLMEPDKALFENKDFKKSLDERISNYHNTRSNGTVNSQILTEDFVNNGLNLYTYCNNNPAVFIDIFGLEAYYIFYNDNTDKDNSSLKDRADKEYNALIKSGVNKNDIYEHVITSEDEFLKEWDNMDNGDSPIRRVALYLHSSPRGLIINGAENQAVMLSEFNGQKITGHLAISDLGQKNIYEMTFYGCNTAHQDYKYGNVTHEFIRTQKQLMKAIGWDGSMNWNWFTGKPKLASNQAYFESWLLDQNNKRKPQGQILYQRLPVINDLTPQFIKEAILISPYKQQ